MRSDFNKVREECWGEMIKKEVKRPPTKLNAHHWKMRKRRKEVKCEEAIIVNSK